MNRLEAAIAAIADADPMTRAKLYGLLVGYDYRWRGASWVTLAVEQEYSLPIVNPDTGRKSRTHTQAGKIDGLVEYEGRPYLLEHKTTSEEISQPDSPYWRKLDIDSQVSAYVLSLWQSGTKPVGTLYDVIRKPAIRPKLLSKKDQDSIFRERTYCGHWVAQDDQIAVGQGETTETPGLFALRLAADCVERSDWYFQRRIVYRLDGEVVEWARELWSVSQDIAKAKRDGSHYRNSGACMLYGSPCEYLGLCSGRDSIVSGRWVIGEKSHEELAGDHGDGALTHSRIRCFQTCRRKHHYRYNLKLRREDEEEKEALRFGSYFHRALEAWWSATDVSDGNFSPGPERLAINNGGESNGDGHAANTPQLAS